MVATNVVFTRTQNKYVALRVKITDQKKFQLNILSRQVKFQLSTFILVIVYGHVLRTRDFAYILYVFQFRCSFEKKRCIYIGIGIATNIVPSMKPRYRVSKNSCISCFSRMEFYIYIIFILTSF